MFCVVIFFVSLGVSATVDWGLRSVVGLSIGSGVSSDVGLSVSFGVVVLSRFLIGNILLLVFLLQ